MPARIYPKLNDRVEVIRFFSSMLYVAGDRDCWIFVNTVGNAERYPCRLIDGKQVRIAAVLLWALGYTKDILSGDRSLMLCHTCDNGEFGCVRPSHIFTGDQFDNMRDSLRKGRNHHASKRYCVNGHDLNDPLIGRVYRGRKGRACLACKRDSDRRMHNRKPDSFHKPSVETMTITKDQIIEAVNKVGGNRKAAASLLGLHQGSLFRKWREFEPVKSMPFGRNV